MKNVYQGVVSLGVQPAMVSFLRDKQLLLLVVEIAQ